MTSNSDNTAGMKELREYKRLLAAILEGQPKRILNKTAYEVAESDDFIGDTTVETVLDRIIREASEDAKRYFIHYQGGRAVPILRKSPLGRKLAKGAFAPADEEC